MRHKPAGSSLPIGLIVEGETEYHAIPRLRADGRLPGCPPIKTTNLRGVGSHVLPAGVAKMIAPKVIQHHVSGRSRIVICLDREQRQQCSVQFAADVRKELVRELATKNRAPPSESIHIVIADRTFEAWILADALGLHRQGIFGARPNFHRFEGELGAQMKKGVVELSRLLGRDYAKTIDGPKLFAKINLADARDYSPGARGSRSLDKLLRSLAV